MIRGRVVGTVWGTRKSEGLSARKLALVAETQDGEPTGRIVVAVDMLDADVHSDVVVAFGSGARNALSPGDRTILCDAAITHRVEGDSCS